MLRSKFLTKRKKNKLDVLGYYFRFPKTFLKHNSFDFVAFRFLILYNFMQLFYTQKISGTSAVFEEVEARHCTQVLRKKIGDEIEFIDGIGNYYKGHLIEASKKKMTAAISEKKENWNALPYKLHIAIAPTKTNERFEWFLEKATEGGIHAVTPIRCRRSERKKINTIRWNKILVTAMKQSKAGILPELSELTDFQSFIKKDFSEMRKYICWCGAENLPFLKEKIKPEEDAVYLIGPEGDFTPEEYQAALDAGFEGISLGKARLRTETAGVYCSLVTSFMNS